MGDSPAFVYRPATGAGPDRSRSAANLTKKRDALALLAQLLDAVLADPAYRFGRVTVDVVVQDHTFQDASGYLLPGQTKVPLRRVK